MTPTANRQIVASHFRALTAITREEIFGDKEPEFCPNNLLLDARTMFAGYVGSKYVPGSGVLFLAINPGGGGDAYVRRTASDEQFYPRLLAFKESTPESVSENFERLNECFKYVVQTWNLWKIMQPTLRAVGCDLDAIAYLNLVPYRTREDRKPPSFACTIAWNRIVGPTIALLEPRMIIALGKKVGSAAGKRLDPAFGYYCIPRTRGDSFISSEAASILDRIREDSIN